MRQQMQSAPWRSECVRQSVARESLMQRQAFLERSKTRAVCFQQRMQIIPGDRRNDCIVTAARQHIAQNRQCVEAVDFAEGD